MRPRFLLMEMERGWEDGEAELGPVLLVSLLALTQWIPFSALWP